MIVENDPFWQQQLQLDLSREEDIEVVSVVSGKEEALLSLQERMLDVVLMDINLTENRLDGIEATRLIERHSKASVRVIMLTSFRESEIIVESFRQGAVNYITKSNYEDLVAAIRDAHQGKAAIHADVAHAVRTELRLSQLSPMEREVYQLKQQGLTKTQIAEKLIKSVNTIKSQLKSIKEKLL
ncbi:response regulator transcription factor [Paenibacillus sp. yr247]|uniref:response regulator transcription factor n=1 Tax=Paenibacillus sp. yr247 TaxID=1761880 RepID=UPI001C319FDE|nr:response regulator transcription factor [Paenibacillus sp. yr247]